MSKQAYRVCFCFRRRSRLTASEAPKPVKVLFQQYSKNEVMSVDQLRRFLIEAQKKNKVTKENAQGIVNKLHEKRYLNTFQRRRPSWNF